MLWEERPLTLGQAHEGFFYPDPLGFWAEIRKWTVELLRPHAQDWGVNEALSVTTLVHQADDAARTQKAIDLCRGALGRFQRRPATAWRPAFSIKTRDGMPISWIVRRSASRI